MASIDTPDDQIIAVNYGDHEPDDWASKHQISLSELASRLDSKMHYDNRGRIVWSDGLEAPTIQWILTTPGLSTIIRSNNCAWRGSNSALFTIQAALGASSTAEKYFYIPTIGRYGLEITWSSERVDFNDIQLRLYYYDGARIVRGAIRILGTSGQLQYNSDLPAWVNLPQQVCLSGDRHYWHKMKFVMDINIEEYIRIMVDGQEHVMTGLGCDAGGSIACRHIMIGVHVTGNAANQQLVYFDDIVFTHLEP